MTNVLKVPFRKLKHIHHISDIQIRNLKRHKEYEEVFNRLYEKVKEYPENAVAYIGGDIAHSKTEMSPELIDQLSRLFKNLSDICPTIIIAGNHDCNLNNLSRMDCLTPIVENLNHPNLHYLKNTGVYKCADVQFVVWDVWDNQKDYPLAKDVEGKTKIVLFHGTVDQSKTDLGFRLPSKVKIAKFRGYDLALLGDIHKRQHLNRKKTISYCGSLVQQNHGEGLDHGYLLWDVPKRKSTYIPVHNDYGYYTLDIDEGKVPDVDDMPQKARLRVRVSNTDSVQLKRALTKIQTIYGIKEIVVNRTDRLTERMRDGQMVDVGDMTNPDYQYDLIEDYLKRNHIVEDEILLKIKDINEELNNQLPVEEISRNVFWKLKRFEFSNMFSYGEDNVVDFTKLNGIIGLFAPNATGKSALLDSLSFALFDTSARAYKAERILNNKKGSFHCKVGFEINETEYFIERKGKRLKNGHVKVDVDFWMIDDSDDRVSLNGDQRRTTNANIRRIIGSYEDFVLTSLSLQNNSTVFIDKTQKERKDLLAQFMGMGTFDQLYTLAHEEISDISAILKDFRKTKYDVDLSEIEKNDTQYKVVQKDLRSQKRTLTTRKRELTDQTLNLTKKLRPVDESIIDIEKLSSDKINYENQLESMDIRLGSVGATKEENKAKIVELKHRIKDYVDKDVNKKYLDLITLEDDKKELRIEIDKLKIEVRNKLDKIEKLGILEWDEDCEFCMSNPFTLDAIDTNEKLDEDKKISGEIISNLDYLDLQIEDMSGIHDNKVDFDRSMEALKTIDINQNKLESEEVLLKERKKNTLHQITVTEERIEKYHESKNDIVYNKQVEEEIDNLKNSVDDLDYQVETIDNKIQTIHGEIQINRTKKKTIMETMNKVEDLQTKYEAYEYYMDAVKRDGVPYELIEKALPTIEGEVNDILSQMVDFGIVLEMDGKNINTYLAYDADNVWPLELSSGMERFISSLAMRVGLINVCNLPRANFLAIDEGFGNMDSDNLNSVYMLFQYLKSQFQFAFIVSHIESMRDTVDSLLEITKTGGFSNITLPSKFN
jgi:DNA repair exonuclease SbcCD ATPase subunit